MSIDELPKPLTSVPVEVVLIQPSRQDATRESFGQSVLTSREAEVVQMILKGHSSLSISHALTIALPTVKTHRRNAYAKLGISTQQQLFRLFLEG